ncbi:serine/threonine-protein kinase [Planctomycetes bacterium K23_9]|uniref:Serine/threonine-protein kinase PknH n=1 Tax=Stieleria marina TaxID=1930275 RepID=A0A517P1G2_9BACT|nr:Serine/threonine-protein kinase PknH [Planctomycetes bacterium K23_9]
MTDWNRSSVESIFREVIAAGDSSQRRILRTIDANKRHEVEQLLQFDAQANEQGLLQSLQTSAEFESRFPSGTLLKDRYRIVSLIGQGGIGEVYRADDLELGTSVALKFQPAQDEVETARDDHLLNEVRLARQISHPNVCRVHDIGEYEGQRFITMQYIDGEDLRSLLHRVGRLSHSKAIEISHQLCSALSAAHARGLLHRDLKPSNIMVDGNGNAYITDFGLAVISSDRTGVGDSPGTPAYMAPEQLLSGVTTVQSDFYSLGLVLYELFTGQRAHAHGSMAELLELHSKASQPTKPSDVIDDLSPAVDAAIRRCLDSDPSGRPLSAASLATQLSAGDPLTATMITDEVPSPDLVATYGERGILSPTTVLVLQFAIVIGLAVILMLCGKSRWVNMAGFDRPEVLQRDARKLISRFGYHTAGFDSANGFLGHEIGQSEASAPAFWYRESPEPLIGIQIPLEAMPANYGTIVNLVDPPWTRPGMLGMKLDAGSGGKLSWFRATPLNQRVDKNLPAATVAWSDWFTKEAIGFELASLSPATWRHTPPDAFDAQMAWEGRLPESNEPIYVEAAAFRGRPTWFRVMKPNEFETADSIPRPVHQNSRGTGVGLSISNIITVLLISFFAMRNWRSRRCDRRAAWKIAVFVFAGQVIGWSCLTSHTLSPSEYFLVRDGLKSAIGSALTAWLVYLALEPVVRRHVPHLLVSWSRLLDGRFVDPIVGRDLLIAVSVAVWVEMLLTCVQSLPGTQPMGIDPIPLQGWPGVIGMAVGGGASFVTWMLIIFTSFILVLRYSRSKILAVAFVFLGIGLSAAARDENLPSAWLYLGIAIIPAVATLRYGLLFLVLFSIFDNLLLLPLTFDPSVFFFETSVFCILVVLVAAFWGGFVALGKKRKRLFG